MRQLHCPNVLAAATRLVEAQKQAEGVCLWALGDALIKDCGYDEGHPASSHAKNGAKATLETAAKELELHGIFREVSSLREIRDIALAFKKADRVAGLRFYAHGEARNPDCLKWIMKTVPSSEKKDKRWGVISVVKIREMAKQYHAAVDRKRQQALLAAEERAAKAVTLDEKRKAKEEVERLETMPKPKAFIEFKPERGELRTMANNMGIDGELIGVKQHLRNTLDQLHALKTDLHPDFRASFIEDLREIRAMLTQIDNYLNGRSNVQNIA